MPELTARLRLIADVRNFAGNLQRAAQQGRTALRGLDKQVGNVGTGLNRANKASKSFFQTLRSNVATQIKAGIMFATLYQALITFRQTIGAAISELLTLDTALRKVQSITKDSDEAIAALGNQLLKAARQGKLFGQTAGEVATGMFEIVQAGFSVAEAYDIALVSAMAATAGFTDAATAGKAITGVLLAYGMAAEEANAVANTLFQTVDTGVITFEEIARGMGAALAPAVALNVPLDEITSAVATMTRKGVPAARAWTAITRMLFGFLDPSDQARQHAEDLGFELNAATIETNGFFGAMLLLNEATGEDSELLADIFDRQRALIGAFTLLTDGGEEWTKVQLEMNGAQEGQGALMEAWIERQKALSVRLEIFRAQVLSVVVTGLRPMAKGLAVVVGWMSAMISDDFGVFKWLKDMATNVTGLSVAWNEFVQALKDMFAEGGSQRFSLMFLGMFVILREGIPVLFQLMTLLLQLSAWALRNKPVLLAVALALGAMFISAHPLLAVFQALFILVGFMEKNWDNWLVRIGGVTAAIGLAVIALNMLWSAFTASSLAMFLFNTNLKGVTSGTNLLMRAMMNLSRAALDAVSPITKFYGALMRSARNAAKAAWSAANALSDILRKPEKIARTVTVTTVTIQKVADRAAVVGKAGTEAVKKGIASGLVQGLVKGIGTGVGASIIAGIVLGLKFAIAAVGIATVGLAAAIVLAVIGVIIAGFLIYKYRDEIWAGLKTLGSVLKEFFTKQLPAMMQPLIDGMMEFFTKTLPTWAKSQFTPANMGRWFGRFLMVAILAAFWPVVLIYKFRDKLLAFVKAVGGFLAELPGLIAGKIGDAAKVIIGWLVDATKWVSEFERKVIEFETSIVAFVVGIPGRIAEFIGDHWKDVLDFLVDAAKWYTHFVVKVIEFYGKIATFVAGIPGRIAEFIGDNWKDFLNFLIDPQAWWELFRTLLQKFIDLVSEKVGPMLAGIGEAIVGGIKSGITSAFSGLGGWIINQAKAALGPLAGWLATGLGALGSFFGAVPSGMKDVIDWLNGGGSEPQSRRNQGYGGFARGVRGFMGGLALVGEAGAELVRLPRGSDVIRNADMGQALRGNAGGMSLNAEVNITTSLLKDFQELKDAVLHAVDEKLDDAAAVAGIASPRYGTWGAGIPRV